MSFLGRLFGTRGVERARERVLEREPVVHGGMTPGQIGVLVEVNSTIAAADVKASRTLLRKQHRLDAADYDAVLAGQRLDATRTNPIWRGRRGGTAQDADGPFVEDFDPHRPLVTNRVLTIVEVVFIVVEVFFWYSIFDDVVEPDAPWYDPSRVAAALLALFIPVVGVATARVIGPLGHRWLAGYPGVGRKDRIGALFAALAFVLALVAVGWLINFRFDEATAPIGSLPPPALPMAAIFVAVLLADAAARVFLVSEIREQSTERAKVFDRLMAAKTRADLAHHRAWEDLRAETQIHLDTIERIVAVGARMIADARAVPPAYPAQFPPPPGADTAPTVSYPPAVGDPRSAHLGGWAAPGTDGTRDGLTGLPSPRALELFGTGMAIGPLRRVEDAIEHLSRCRPEDSATTARRITELRERLFHLEPLGAPTSRATQPVNGYLPPVARAEEEQRS